MSAAASLAAAREAAARAADSVRTTADNPLTEVFVRLTLRAAWQLTVAVGGALAVALALRAVIVAVLAFFEDEPPPPPPPPRRLERRQERREREEDDAAWAEQARAGIRRILWRNAPLLRALRSRGRHRRAQEEEDRRWEENERHGKPQHRSRRGRAERPPTQERFYYGDD
jgi:hypothetical protein